MVTFIPSDNRVNIMSKSNQQGMITFDQALITTESNLFKITVTAAHNGLRRTGEGIIQRKENQEQVLLYWKIQ